MLERLNESRSSVAQSGWSGSFQRGELPTIWSEPSVPKPSEGWLEDHRYLNMEFLKEQKKELRTAA